MLKKKKKKETEKGVGNTHSQHFLPTAACLVVVLEQSS